MSEPVSAISQVVSSVSDFMTSLVEGATAIVLANNLKKREEAAFERQFVPTPDAIIARFKAMEDQTPIYLMVGLAVLILVALILLARSKKT